MTMTQISRTITNRAQVRRRVQRLVHLSGGTDSPSETAIRSIDEFRSTPRW